MSARRRRGARTISDGCGGSLWRYLLAGGSWLIALAVYLSLSVYSAYHPQAVVPRWAVVMMGLDLLIGLVSLYVIRYRYRAPVKVAALLALTTLVSVSSVMTSLWAYAHLATRRRWRPVILVGLLHVAIACSAPLVSLVVGWDVLAWPFAVLGADDASLTSWGQVLNQGIGAVLMVIIMGAIGSYVGARRDLLASLSERAVTAERQQELRVLQGQAEERDRIAREMHDVLAHRISLVSMHAGVLAYREDLSREQTREIAGVIQENAHQSMTELRAILGSLRQDDPGPDAPPEKPQPGLDGLPDLFEEAKLAGQRVELSDTVEHPELLPRLVGRHVYRVVQEIITNARKHAPDVLLKLTLTGAPGQGYTVRGVNPIRAGRIPAPESGMGLIGLKERASVTGGWMRAGQNDHQDFEVEVWFPW